MALIVEDGSSKTDADALCSVAFVDTYNITLIVNDTSGNVNDSESIIVII